MARATRTFLLRQLIELATRERELLEAEQWEQAIELHGQFDRDLAQLQHLAGTEPLGARHRNDLARLDHLHRGNLALLEELRGKAGSARAELSNVRRIGGYAPLGPDHDPAPRYLDQSA